MLARSDVSSSPLLLADEPVGRSFWSGRAAPRRSSSCATTRARASRGGSSTSGSRRAERLRHIAWDIGALAVAQRLSERFDATLVAQGYSRLVIDCNRPLGTPQSIALTSERTRITGNDGVSRRGRAAARRVDLRALPRGHRRGARGAARPAAADGARVGAQLHAGVPRRRPAAGTPAVLYKRDARLAHACCWRSCAPSPDLVVGDNEPYAVSDETDYAIPVHGEQRGDTRTSASRYGRT